MTVIERKYRGSVVNASCRMSLFKTVPGLIRPPIPWYLSRHFRDRNETDYGRELKRGETATKGGDA